MARRIEVFTAGCGICAETLDIVKRATQACGCEVVEKRCADKATLNEAKSYGIKSLPSIVLNGVLVFEGKPEQKWADAMLKL